jgi:toxin FitB
MNYLLDTCVLSELGRPRPHAVVVAWLAQQNPQHLFISQVTVAELQSGEVKLRWKDAERADKLAAWINGVLLRFADQTLPTDHAVWAIWAQLCGTADAQGKSIAPLDGLLMATAQQHGLTVVTRNVSDFSAYSHVFNPWETM